MVVRGGVDFGWASTCLGHRIGTGAAKADDAPGALRIGVSIPAADHGWTAGVIWWARRAMALHPEIDWEFATASDPEKQVADIEDMMARNVDGLVILATNSGPHHPDRQSRRTIGESISSTWIADFCSRSRTFFSRGTTKPSGARPRNIMSQKLDGKGNIVILEGAPVAR